MGNKIIFLTKSNYFGGCEKLLIEYLKGIDYSKQDVVLVSTKDVFSSEIGNLNLPVIIKLYPFKLNGYRFFNGLKLYKFLKIWGKSNKIVFFQGAFQVFKWPEYCAAYLLSPGKIFSVENSGPLINPLENKNLIQYFENFKRVKLLSLRSRFCKRIIVVSSEIKDRLIHWYRYPAKKIWLAHSGVDLNNFKQNIDGRSALRARMGIPKDEVVIVSTARLSREKCLDRLVNAFDFFNSSNDRKCSLLIVGNGPEEDGLRQLVEHKKFKKKIYMTGFQKNVADYLNISDIFVLPSDMEGFSIAMLEAMASGLVIVRTDTCGASEIIEDGINGFIVPRTMEGIMDGLSRAVNLSANNREAMINRNIDLIKQKFQLDENIKVALSCIETI